MMCLLLPNGIGAAESPKDVELKVAAHIHSRFSHGSTESIDKIAGYAEQRGMDALLLTDTAIAEWSYGLPYSGRLMEVRRREDSILKLGPEAYLSEIERASKAHPSVLLIPGTEPAAFYRWTGKPWSGLVIHDWHRHMLLVGLHHPEDYRGLPILGNRQAYSFCSWMLWPFLVLALAYSGQKAGLSILSKILYLFGAVSLISVFPFRCFSWDPYQAATPWEPYRELARYGKSRGALVFLAHPESPNWARPLPVSGRVSIATDPYPEGLQEIPDLDGFGVFLEGYKTMAEPGGAWDQALGDYCAGRRENPPWGIAELDYKGWGLMGTYIDTDYMLVRARAKTEPAILDALRNGRFYDVAPAKSGALRLDAWEASAQGKAAGSGETLRTDGPARLTLALSRIGSKVRTRVRVIRNGKTVSDEFRALPSRWTLDEPAPGSCDFYRVMVRDDDNGYLAPNPIFVRGNSRN